MARLYTEDVTAGLPFGVNFPTLEWLTTGRSYGIPHSLIAFLARRSSWASCCTGRCSADTSSPSARTRRRPATLASDTWKVIVSAYVVCTGLTALAAVFIAMYTAVDLAGLARQFLRTLRHSGGGVGGCSLRGGEGSILGVVMGTVLLQVLRNS